MSQVDLYKEVQGMTESDLKVFLERRGFQDPILEKLEEEGVDGQTFLLLTGSHFKDMGLKTGPAVKLTTLVNLITASNTANEKRSSTELPGTSQQSFSANENNVIEAHAVELTDETNNQDSPLPSSITSLSSKPSAPSSNAQKQHLTVKRLTYNFLDILQSNLPVGKRIYEDFVRRGNKYVFDHERVEIVKIAVKHLTIKDLYPTSEEKSAMALAIVKAFPSLKSVICLPAVSSTSETEDITEAGAYNETIDEIDPLNPIISQTYAQFYHPKAGGFIETRLKTLRKNLAVEERKRKPNTASSFREGKKKRNVRVRGSALEDSLDLQDPQMSPEVVDYQINWMKTHPPTSTNKAELLGFMDSTFHYRKTFVMSSDAQSATCILEKFPVLKAFEGRLILEDFKRRYRNATRLNVFVRNFSKPLEALAKFEFPNENFVSQGADECLKSMLLLLRTHSRQKVSTQTFTKLSDRLFLFANNMEYVEDLVHQRLRSQSQPLLIILGSLDDPLRFFLVIDQEIIPCGQDSITAMEILFASFFTFNLKYPTPLCPFYSFLVESVFNIGPPHRNPSNTALLGRLVFTKQQLELEQGSQKE